MESVQQQFFNLELWRAAFPALLLEGLRNTLFLSIGAAVFGTVFGMLLALLGISRRRWLRLPTVVYIDVFRGLPAILTITLVGVGMPLAGFRPFGRERLLYGMLALGLIATAYIAEIFRAGIQSVEQGQMESARSLGMPYLMAMRLVVIPQGVRRVLPPLTNELIALIKDSSLVFVIGTTMGERELFRVGQSVAQQNANYSPVMLAGLFYMAITIPLTRVVNHLDRRLREGRPGAGQEDLPISARPEHAA